MSATQNNIVAAFIERPGWTGITGYEAQALAKLVTHTDDNPSLHPIEIDAASVESSAIGFVDTAIISDESKQRDLVNYVASILDDIELENADCVYSVSLAGTPAHIYLGREAPGTRPISPKTALLPLDIDPFAKFMSTLMASCASACKADPRVMLDLRDGTNLSLIFVDGTWLITHNSMGMPDDEAFVIITTDYHAISDIVSVAHRAFDDLIDDDDMRRIDIDMTDLMSAYDIYIQTANKLDSYKIGFRPKSISTFAMSDYLDVWIPCQNDRARVFERRALMQDRIGA